MTFNDLEQRNDRKRELSLPYLSFWFYQVYSPHPLASLPMVVSVYLLIILLHLHKLSIAADSLYGLS